jgi:hypothetical protein
MYLSLQDKIVWHGSGYKVFHYGPHTKLERENIMNWIELIQLRSYSQTDRDEAASAFHQLSSPNREKGLSDIRLFENHTLNNDLIICLNWWGKIPKMGKSPLGLQVASAFSQFGQVYHTVWTTQGKLAVNERGQAS